MNFYVNIIFYFYNPLKYHFLCWQGLKCIDCIPCWLVTYTHTHTKKGLPKGLLTPNSSSEDLGNIEYSFITITPKSTLV